jgi:hypothetical protein
MNRSISAVGEAAQHRGRQVRGGADRPGAQGRAAARGLDVQRQPELGQDEIDDRRRAEVVEGFPWQCHRQRRDQSGRRGQGLGRRLVEGHLAGAGHRADVRHAEQPEHLPDRAVLTADPVDGREHGAGRVGSQHRQQRRVGVRDDRVQAGLGQGVTDPVAGPQRNLPLRGQAAGQDDDTLKIVHDFEKQP